VYVAVRGQKGVITTADNERTTNDVAVRNHQCPEIRYGGQRNRVKVNSVV